MGGNYTELSNPILGRPNLVIYVCDKDRRYGQDGETGTGCEINGGRYTEIPGDTTAVGSHQCYFNF